MQPVAAFFSSQTRRGRRIRRKQKSKEMMPQKKSVAGGGWSARARVDSRAQAQPGDEKLNMAALARVFDLCA
jgi:hypothetical protein